MCEFGRIVHHLKNNCTDKRNSILIVGFQAVNTLGRRIVERQPVLKIFGNEYPLRARVKVLNSLSAHAGRSELIDFGARFKDSADKVLLVCTYVTLGFIGSGDRFGSRFYSADRQRRYR